MPKLFLRIAVLLLALYSPVMLAAPLKRISYDNVGELQVASYASLSASAPVMRRILKQCAEVKEISQTFPAIEKRWLDRNAKLQALLPIYSEIYSNSKIEQVLKAAGLIGGVAMDVGLKGDLQSCKQLAERLDSGGLDIDSDPQIKIYLNESFNEFSANGNPIEPIAISCYVQYYGGNRILAKSSCRRAAKSGGAYGQFLHGLMLSPSNSSDPKENTKARKFIRAAAVAGISNAQRVLASDYHMGFRGPVDFAQAKYWYEKSVAQFDNIAPLYLAGIYIKGQGVKVDLKKGYAYAALSARRGNTNASAALRAITDEFELSVAVRKSAEEQANSIELDLRSKSALFKGFTK